MRNIMDILNNAALKNNCGMKCIVKFGNKNMRGIISNDKDILRINNMEIINEHVHLRIGSIVTINSSKFKIINVMISGQSTGTWSWRIQEI